MRGVATGEGPTCEGGGGGRAVALALWDRRETTGRWREMGQRSSVAVTQDQPHLLVGVGVDKGSWEGRGLPRRSRPRCRWRWPGLVEAVMARTLRVEGFRQLDPEDQVPGRRAGAAGRARLQGGELTSVAGWVGPQGLRV